MFKIWARLSLAFLCLWFKNYVEGLPQGLQIKAGKGEFHNPHAGFSEITASDGAIIGFDSFNIQAQETVRFIQPSNSARVLAEVNGGGQSYINGTLLSNGSLYLVNPCGIFFEKTAVVDVGSLFAVAGSLDHQAFQERGPLNFTLLSSVENHGFMRGKEITLLGTQVSNFGSILAPQGAVTLVSGKEVFVGEKGSRIFLKFPEGGSKEGIAIEQAGEIKASGGEIRIAAGDLYGAAIHAAGELEARRIHLDGAKGKVEISGRVSTGEEALGHIEIRGERIGLYGAEIDASAKGRGGTVLVGSDYRGQGEGKKAEVVLVDKESRIVADSLEEGHGGKIIVWAEDWTHFDGNISARGAGDSYSGGFAEVSAKNSLVYNGIADLRSSSGKMGTLLLDPSFVLIVQGNGADDGDLPTIDSSSPPVPYVLGSNGFAAQAANANIVVESTGGIDMASFGGGTLALPTTVGSSVTFDANSDGVGTGNFRMLDTSDSITTAGGDLIISGTALTLGQLNTGTGAVNLTSTNNTTCQSIQSGSLELSVSTLIAQGAITVSSGDLTINALGPSSGITAQGDLQATNGSIFLNFDPATNNSIAGSFDGDVIASQDVTITDLNAGRWNGPAGSTIEATNGTLTLQGSINKTQGGGDFIFNAGTLLDAETLNVNSPGSNLVINCPFSISGSVISNGSMTLNDSGAFTGTPAARLLTGLTGIVMNGDYDLGKLLVVTTSDFDLNGSITGTSFAGGLIFNVSNSFACSGNLAVDSFIRGARNGLDYEFDGIGDQSVVSNNNLVEFSDSVLKSTAGNLVLSGSSLNLGGDVIVSSGSLGCTGSLALEGNLSAAGITLNDSVTLNGSGSQTLDSLSGTFLSLDTISKAAGADLTLQASTGGSLDLRDDITLSTGGTLTLNNVGAGGSGQFQGNLDVQGGGDISLLGNFICNGSGTQILEADGTVSVTGDLNRPSGSLQLNSSGGNTVGGHISVPLGGVTLIGPSAVSGDIGTGTGITLAGLLNLDGVGNQRLSVDSGTLALADVVNKTSSGNLNLSGSAGVDIDNSVTVSSGNLIFEDDLNLSISLSPNGALEFQGGSTLDGVGAQTLSPSRNLFINDLSKTTAGALNLSALAIVLNGGTISSIGDQNWTGPVELAGNSTISGPNIDIAGNIDGASNVIMQNTGLPPSEVILEML